VDVLAGALSQIFAIPGTSILFLAPPAWGKTQILWKLLASKKKIFFISPLRALAAEFYEKALADGIKSFYREARGEFACQEDIDLSIYTPELYLKDHFEGKFSKIDFCNKLLVIDEIHLFFLWGHSFRPHLLDFLELALGDFQNTFALSATMSPCNKKEYQKIWEHCFEENFLLNLGNFKFKNIPTGHFCTYFFSKKMQDLIMKNFLLSSKKARVLVFVKYREEAKQLNLWCQSRGVLSLYCIGGEVQEFREKLSRSIPQVIISTSALGHGVNLPDINDVFFNYNEPNTALRIQMMTRGGRRGQVYYVFTPFWMKVREKERFFKYFYLLKRFIYGAVWNFIRKGQLRGKALNLSLSSRK
jgi:superfamily II DNA helicase RecQ